MHRLLKRQVAGIPLTMTTPSIVARRICETVSDGQHDGHDIHLINAYSIALSEGNPEFRRCLEEASHNLPDGKPLSWVTRHTSAPLTQVRGPKLFEMVIDIGRDYGIRHFLLGSTPETLRLLESSLVRRYPGAQIAGSFSPPFRAMTPHDYVEQDNLLRRSGANLIWVGLGTPKQDREAQRLAREGGFFAIAVGAAFDFSAGTKKEAPSWIGRIGLEWLYRFASEPRRLWRRYLIGNLLFIRAVMKGNPPK